MTSQTKIMPQGKPPEIIFVILCFPAPNDKTQQGFNRCVFSETKYMNIIYTYKECYKNV